MNQQRILLWAIQLSGNMRKAHTQKYVTHEMIFTHICICTNVTGH